MIQPTFTLLSNWLNLKTVTGDFSTTPKLINEPFLHGLGRYQKCDDSLGVNFIPTRHCVKLIDTRYRGINLNAGRHHLIIASPASQMSDGL